MINKRYLLAMLLCLGLQAPLLADHHLGPEKAKAVLMPTADSEAKGWVLFAASGKKMRVWGEVSGLSPGQHGFHIHEFGDCSSADGSSAGGHYAPHDSSHGAPEAKQSHVGDLGNITADASGKASFDMTLDDLSLHGMASILGRGLIVHAKADDLKSQPSGNAGGRVACGVIGVSK